jgi:hypothetical protein
MCPANPALADQADADHRQTIAVVAINVNSAQFWAPMGQNTPESLWSINCVFVSRSGTQTTMTKPTAVLFSSRTLAAVEPEIADLRPTPPLRCAAMAHQTVLSCMDYRPEGSGSTGRIVAYPGRFEELPANLHVIGVGIVFQDALLSYLRANLN